MKNIFLFFECFSFCVGQYKIVCYFTNWAWYRPSPGKFFPEDTDPNLCTHVVYGFATLDYTELVIRVFDTWADIDNGTCAIRLVYLFPSGRGFFFKRNLIAVRSRFLRTSSGAQATRRQGVHRVGRMERFGRRQVQPSGQQPFEPPKVHRQRAPFHAKIRVRRPGRRLGVSKVLAGCYRLKTDLLHG